MHSKNEGKTDCRAAFAKAIRKASAMKGAKIVVPAGTYYIKGPIVLASNVCIELQKGATLKFAPEEKYYPVVSITNSPFWCVHLLKSENIICRNLRYDAKLMNNDGIDPECSRNVLIEGVEFNNGDDNVAIKSGRESAGVRNVIVEDCDYAGYCKRGIFIKTNPDRGGFAENVYVKNRSFNEVEDLFYVTSRYAGEGQDNHHL